MNYVKKHIFWVLLVTLGILSVYLMIILGFWFLNKDKIYPRVTVAGVKLSGLTEKEAEEELSRVTNRYLEEKININSQKPEIVTAGDLGIKFDIEKTISDALELGNKNPFILGSDQELSLSVEFKDDSIYKLIDKQNENLKTSVISPEIYFEGIELKSKDGDSGIRVNYPETFHGFKLSAERLSSEYFIKTFTVGDGGLTGISEKQKLEIIEKTKNQMTLKSPEKDYFIDTKAKLSFVDITGSDISYALMFEGDKYLFPGKDITSSIFSERKIAIYVSNLASEINKNSTSAILGVTDGKVIITKKEIDGQKINIDKASSMIASAIDLNEDVINLPVEITKAEIRSDNLVELGITELLSTGYSSFTGSSANRKHNIRVGASKFNGVLIRPGETFSFITTLGPVDASTGYLPELVIKDNKTIPEYGGGMCQVSSTAFRAALNAGLPIVERRAHSYPVSYYKPYGVDATVYIPKPDLVFKNDTDKYIFMQTRIEGTKLSFDFYGTKSGKKIVFAGNENANSSVPIVEKVNPFIYDQGARGNGSFSAIIWRFIYDETGKLISQSKFVSKYDSPDKYPH